MRFSITNGGIVKSGAACLGYYGIGVATVKGAGSAWIDSSFLCVGGGFSGSSGSGSLAVANGGSVSDTAAFIASNGSVGTVVVTGAGSVWNNGGTLSVGDNTYRSTATLITIGGGTVTATNVAIGQYSLLAIDIGRGSVLTVGVGAGTLTNDGTVRFLAGAGVPADGSEYSPILAKKWTYDYGTPTLVQAIGGTWNGARHTFTASSVTSGTSGSGVSLNLATVQRALVNDNSPGGTNWQVGASFVAAGSTRNIVFTATAMDITLLDILRSQLPAREPVLDGWNFSTANYAVSSTNPVYLSFNVGPGYSSDDLAVWHYDGNGWTSFSPMDLTYDGTYASFTATSFSGYAMVGVVPEPGTVVLLVVGLLGVLIRVRRIKSGR